GRRPDAQSTSGPAGQGTSVRVDPFRFIASEGSVSVIDLQSGKLLKEIVTEMHSSGMALSPNKCYLAVANTGSDTVSVIDTRTDEVAETISLRWQPKDLFGASPDALAFDSTGKKLYVCNGTQNAIAVVRFQPGLHRAEVAHNAQTTAATATQAGKSQPIGLVSTRLDPGTIPN